ncbi:hypothetical protein DESC_740047 [Desulfosarcina cetonica]|nr:hypothetical protein DESC_740047 [Desulfosarcina cetonica]
MTGSFTTKRQSYKFLLLDKY